MHFHSFLLPTLFCAIYCYAAPSNLGLQIKTTATNVASRTDRRPVAGGVYDPAVQKTFISWSGVDANTFLQSYDHKSKQFSDPVFLADGLGDSHNYPTLIQAGDGHLLIVRGIHNEATVLSRSAAPHSILGNWSTMSVEEGLADSYPMPVRIKDNRIIVFYRETVEEIDPTADTDFRPMKYLISEDDGMTWQNSVAITGDAWAIGSNNRTDHMNEVYIGQLRYVPEKDRIEFAYTLAGGGPTQHKHDVFHRNVYFLSFSTVNLHFYSASGVDLGTQVTDDDQERFLKIVETPVALAAGSIKSPDYILEVGHDAVYNPFVIWATFDETTLIHDNIAAWDPARKNWQVSEITTTKGQRIRDIEPLGGGIYRAYGTVDFQNDVSTTLITVAAGHTMFKPETVLKTPAPVQRVEIITGFRDPARALITGNSTARDVSVADGNIYVAGFGF